MANESVPPGIAPKLPDRQPMVEEKKGFSLTKREKVITGIAAVLLLALGVLFLLFAIQSGRTPKQVVERQAGEGLLVQEEIVQVGLPGDGSRSAYFYVSDDNTLACALLQRGAGGYTVADVAGKLSLTASGADTKGVWKLLLGNKNETFVFGILYDDALKGAEVDGNPAVVVDTGLYRVWFFHGDGSVSIDSGSVTYV